jgi:hypothetical protein
LTDPRASSPILYSAGNPNPWHTITFDMPGGPGVYVDKVVLMSPGSVTHQRDMHERYVEL